MYIHTHTHTHTPLFTAIPKVTSAHECRPTRTLLLSWEEVVVEATVGKEYEGESVLMRVSVLVTEAVKEDDKESWSPVLLFEVQFVAETFGSHLRKKRKKTK